jgi:hypothetical protein
VTVINWFVASHDLAEVGRLTGELGLVGLEAFGKPLLYTLFVVALAGAFRGEGITAIDDDASSTAGDQAVSVAGNGRSGTRGEQHG